VYAILYFDTEDSISPPEAGNDDIVLWVADVMSQYGVTGSFHIIGDKARTLETRGRKDVIEAVKRHDASSHYNHGSVHPTTPELVAPSQWDQGVRIALERERPGFADVERIFGVCGGLTRHGGSYAPQIIRAAGLCGKPYYGMPFHPPGHRAFWFCGTQVFAGHGLVFNDQNRGSIGHFEPSYPDDNAFNAQLETFDKALHDTMAKWDFSALFGAHPLRFNTTEFACANYYNGVNKDPLIPPGQRTEQEKKIMRANFERLVQYLGKVDGLKTVGLSELAQLFSRVESEITDQCLVAYAEQVLDTDDVPLHDRFSPAELLLAMAISLEADRRYGSLPQTVPVLGVLGPTEITAPAELAGDVSTADLQPLVDGIINEALLAERLPSRISIDGRTYDSAASLTVLAQAYLACHAGQPRDHFEARARHAYPRFVDQWREPIASLAKWKVFPSDMDFSNIVELTCRQCWTVKPAHLSADHVG